MTTHPERAVEVCTRCYGNTSKRTTFIDIQSGGFVKAPDVRKMYSNRYSRKLSNKHTLSLSPLAVLLSWWKSTKKGEFINSLRVSKPG